MDTSPVNHDPRVEDLLAECERMQASVADMLARLDARWPEPARLEVVR